MSPKTNLVPQTLALSPTSRGSPLTDYTCVAVARREEQRGEVPASWWRPAQNMRKLDQLTKSLIRCNKSSHHYQLLCHPEHKAGACPNKAKSAVELCPLSILSGAGSRRQEDLEVNTERPRCLLGLFTPENPIEQRTKYPATELAPKVELQCPLQEFLFSTGHSARAPLCQALSRTRSPRRPPPVECAQAAT